MSDTTSRQRERYREWRIERHPIDEPGSRQKTIYGPDGELRGVMFTTEDARLAVNALNALRPDALTALVIALDPEPEAGDLCRVCCCTDPEYDEPHTSDCAYMVARRLVGRGPAEDGGSALLGEPGARAAGMGA